MRTLEVVGLMIVFMAPVQADYSKKDRGSSSAAFLKLTPGARESAMGQTGTAGAEGAGSVYWNPAMMAENGKRNLLLSHSVYLEETGHSYAAASLPLGNQRGFGLALNYFNPGGIQQTDDVGKVLGEFSPSDYAVSAGFSFPVSSFRIGLVGKYVYSKIINTAATYTVDAGLSYSFPSKRTSIGVVAQNIGGELAYGRVKEDLPALFRGGITHSFSGRLAVNLEQVFPRDDATYTALGLEHKAENRNQFGYAVRGGYNQGLTREKNGAAGLTLGAGLILGLLNLDYAWVPLGDLGQNQQLSLHFRSRM